jgi:hypothetical protein
MSLKAFEKNIQSQFGEDGVIEEIFKRIGKRNRVCVEFGAWDGTYLSNTWALWHEMEWTTILIEGDETKYQQLLEVTNQFKNVKTINKYVCVNGENSLDNILQELEIPKDFELLSIDIDGNDYYIFESVTRFKPRLIIVEYNPTIPPNISIKQDPDEYFGSSALALSELANKKGYIMVHMTLTNIFFIEESEFGMMNMPVPTINELFPHDHLTFVLSAFDGRLLLSQKPAYLNEIPIEEKINKSGLFKRKKMIHNQTNKIFYSGDNRLIQVTIFEKDKVK